MNNELGDLLKNLRGYNSLRTISEKTNGQISFSYLGALERGINPGTGQPVKVTPDKLKILAEVYNYSYDELLKLAGYLANENRIEKLYSEFKKLTENEKQKFINLIQK